MPSSCSPDGRPSDVGIVVGVDTRPSGLAALAWAAELGRVTGQPVRAVLVAPTPVVPFTCIDGFTLTLPQTDVFDASVALERALELAIDDPGLREAVERRVLIGPVVDRLLAESEGASVLVVGMSPGRRRRLFSTAGQLLSRAACPVVVVPPEAGARVERIRPLAEPELAWQLAS